MIVTHAYKTIPSRNEEIVHSAIGTFLFSKGLSEAQCASPTRRLCSLIREHVHLHTFSSA